MQNFGEKHTIKPFPIDRFAARPIMAGKVAALDHELQVELFRRYIMCFMKSAYLRNNSVECAPCITKSVLPRSQLTEVARGLRNNIVI